MVDLLNSILASIIATVVVGVGAYKYIINKKYKNEGITQEKGKNQIAVQKSKKNSINIGGEGSENGKRDKSK
ncbi:hypothetical protein [Bacillus piscicola]|uniref:hypothetical protein n=1 Tax=Bacillus piscicola TaxID=1632684 RepID=UPI001F09A1B4|nr:hypothetical protein [Bacillus piscicola]